MLPMDISMLPMGLYIGYGTMWAIGLSSLAKTFFREIHECKISVTFHWFLNISLCASLSMKRLYIMIDRFYGEIENPES